MFVQTTEECRLAVPLFRHAVNPDPQKFRLQHPLLKARCFDKFLPKLFGGLHWFAEHPGHARFDAFYVQIVRNLLVNETYVLYQCGTTPPSTNSVPAGAKLFAIPLTSVAVLETVPIAYLVLTLI